MVEILFLTLMINKMPQYINMRMESANAKWEKSPGDQDILGSESLWTWSDVTLLEDLIGQGAGEEEIAYHVHQWEGAFHSFEEDEVLEVIKTTEG